MLKQRNTETGEIVQETASETVRKTARAERVAQPVTYWLRKAFLPVGYPQSVSQDYWDYQVHDTLQALYSTLSGMLASRSMFMALGVGSKEASATAAAVSNAVRDLVSNFSRLFFAARASTALDRRAKTWRLIADGLNDLAMLIELLVPIFPSSLFLVFACSASMFRAIVGVAGGGTRAALTSHQARMGNHADVSAKDGSQETAVNIVGLLVGIMLLRVLDKFGPWLTWVVFLLLVAGHLYENYMAVRSVIMERINDQRMECIVDILCKNDKDVLPTPVSVNAIESVFWNPKNGGVSVVLGATFAQCLEYAGLEREKLLRKLAEDGNKNRYSIVLSADKKTVLLTVFEGITNAELHKAVFLCYAVKRLLDVDEANKLFGNFCALADNNDPFEKFGWDTSFHLFDLKPIVFTTDK